MMQYSNGAKSFDNVPGMSITRVLAEIRADLSYDAIIKS